MSSGSVLLDAIHIDVLGRFIETLKDPKVWLMAFFAAVSYVFITRLLFITLISVPDKSSILCVHFIVTWTLLTLYLAY